MKKYKAVSLCLAVAVSGSLFSGCNLFKSKPTGENVKNYPVKIEFMKDAGSQAKVDDFIKRKIDEKLGIDFNLSNTVIGEEYANQINLRLASANLPDLFNPPGSTVGSAPGANARAFIKKNGKDGVLLELTPYLDKLKDLRNFIGEDGIKKGTFDGKVYSFAQLPNIPSGTLWVRKDWLDKLGLKVPTTPAEVVEVAKAFTLRDPDGNGQKDTYGLTGTGFETFKGIYGAYGTGQAKDFYVKNGQVYNSLYDPAFVEVLKVIRELISSGSVDPDFAVKGQDERQKCYQGKAGMFYTLWSNLVKDDAAMQIIKDINPNAEWVQAGALTGPAGQYDGTWDYGATVNYTLISSKASADPNKLQKIFDLLNYVSTDEGLRLVQYGEQGKHYNMEGNKVVATDLMGKEGGWFWIYQLAGRKDKEYLSTKFPKKADLIEFEAAQPRFELLSGYTDKPETFNSTDAERFINDEMIKFMYGTKSLDEYKGFIKTLEDKYGYKA